MIHITPCSFYNAWCLYDTKFENICWWCSYLSDLSHAHKWNWLSDFNVRFFVTTVRKLNDSRTASGMMLSDLFIESGSTGGRHILSWNNRKEEPATYSQEESTTITFIDTCRKQYKFFFFDQDEWYNWNVSSLNNEIASIH